MLSAIVLTWGGFIECVLAVLVVLLLVALLPGSPWRGPRNP